MKTVLHLLIKTLASFPLGLRVRIGRIAGALFSYIPTRDRKIAELQLKNFLKDKYSPTLLRAVYSSLGETVMESLNLRPILSNLDSYIDSPDWSIAERVVTQGRPIICLTAHLGNWDLLAAYCIKRNIPITTIGREARVGGMQEVLSEIRDSYGIKTIWRSDKNAVKTIIQELKDNRVVAALIDQDTDVSSSYVSFFGTPVRCPSGLVVVAKRLECLVTAAFLVRVGTCRYQVHVHELDGTKEVDQILADYHSLLEEYIRLYPDQWVWVHKRWRSLPDGKRLSSRDYVEFLTNRLKSLGYG